MRLHLLLSTLLLVLALAPAPGAAIKLRIATTECIEEVIDEPKSLVTMSIVAGADDSRPAFFDIVVRPPPVAVCTTEPLHPLP